MNNLLLFKLAKSVYIWEANYLSFNCRDKWLQIYLTTFVRGSPRKWRDHATVKFKPKLWKVEMTSTVAIILVTLKGGKYV